MILALVTAPSEEEDLSLTLDPDTAWVGVQVTVTGTGYDACSDPSESTVRIHFADTNPTDNRQLATTQLDQEEYRFKTSFYVNSDMTLGDHWVATECGDPNDGGEIVEERLKVTAPPPPSSKPGLALSPPKVEPGAKVEARGSGFDDCLPPGYTWDPGSDGPDNHAAPPLVRLTWRPSSDGLNENEATLATEPAQTMVGTKGTFATAFLVPVGSRAGEYQVLARCDRQRGSGPNPVEASSVLTVSPPVIIDRPPPPKIGPPSPTIGLPPTGGTSTISPPQSSVIGLPPPGNDGGGDGKPSSLGPVLGGLAALALVALAVPAIRKVRAVAAAKAPGHASQPPVVDARLVTRGSSPPRHRTTGPGRTVAVRVVAHRDAGVQTVRWVGEARG